MRLVTLKRRAEFLAIRGGPRWSGASFLIEARADPDGILSGSPARFGFTVTKKLGGAVVRNRIRRRLREAVRTAAPAGARAGFDYVIVARAGACDAAFTDLVRDLEAAFVRLHAVRGGERAGHSGERPRRRDPLPPSQPGRSTPRKG